MTSHLNPRALALILLVVGATSVHGGGVQPAREQRLIVRVEPLDIGDRTRDEMPAEVVLEGGELARDLTSLRVIRVNESGRAIDDTALPFRWYDDAVAYDFPEFSDSVSRTAGKLKPEPRVRGGYYLNVAGDGRKGRLVWMHTQIGSDAAWYAIEFNWLKAGQVAKELPPQNWMGDGQPRCAETATQSVHSDHLRIDLNDWNGDGLIDLIVGDDFGHVVCWPNLGDRKSPKFEYTELLADEDGIPIDVGTLAAPRVCDWDGDGDRDLLIGTYRNKIVWFENVRPSPTPTALDGARIPDGANPARDSMPTHAGRPSNPPILKYRGFVLLDGQPLELPVTPLTRGEPEVFRLDYYPVPDFVDWDADGDCDLLAGGYITGCVFLYESVQFQRGSVPTLVARGPLEAHGKTLNVGHWCASPCAADLDNDGDPDLLSGHTPMREPGRKAGLRLFTNIGNAKQPRLAEGDLDAEHLWPVPLGTPRTFDWDNDGDMDLVISSRKLIMLLENTGSKTVPKFSEPPMSILPKWGPAPVHADQLLDWNADGRIDLVSGFNVRLNDGAANPWKWSAAIPVLPSGVTIEHRLGRGDEEHSTFLNDFNSDGTLDVLFGDWFGHVWLHQNRGTAEKSDFDVVGQKLLTIDGSPIRVGPVGLDPDKDFNALQGARTVVTAGDFNADGRKDLIVGDTFGKVRYFAQTASQSSEPVFSAAVEIGDLGIRLNVCATDWNQDGRMDVIAGSANGNVRVFLNSGNTSGTSPFEAGFAPALPPIVQPRILAGDLNGDGDDDLYFPGTQGACFVERSFLNHGYARGLNHAAARDGSGG